MAISWLVGTSGAPDETFRELDCGVTEAGWVGSGVPNVEFHWLRAVGRQLCGYDEYSLPLSLMDTEPRGERRAEGKALTQKFGTDSTRDDLP